MTKDLEVSVLEYFFKDFVYLFLERGGEREKHHCEVASH